MELTVASSTGAMLTRLDAPALPGDYTRMRGFLPRMYRLFLDGDAIPRRVSQAERAARGRSAHRARRARQARNRAVRRAAMKTASSSPRRRRSTPPTASRCFGVIQLAQTADRWLTLRDRALTRLLNLTLFVTLFAVVAAFWFAGRMTLRISRLGAASETALGREGNLSRVLPEADARDELGDLSRSFSSLLGRLDEYTGYLRTLAGKLAHEIRTPLTIIRSSLENLESEGRLVARTRKVYISRAREGSERLGAILTAMGAATRVEEAIAHSERQRFDLGGAGPRGGRCLWRRVPAAAVRLRGPDEAVEITGAPDLIVQMLDKLIDNAVDFSADGATITVSSAQRTPPAPRCRWPIPGRLCRPKPPPACSNRCGSRASRADKRPHFGLGLYIVRLIAEFHGGSAQAANLPDNSGAVFTVRLAR